MNRPAVTASKALGLQAGDHRAIFGNRGGDVRHAEPLEDLAGDVRRRAGDLAVGADCRVGRLIGNGDAGKALFLQRLQLVGGDRWRRTEHYGGKAGDPGQSCDCFHDFTPG
jgi:hypothetical protein